MGQGDNWANISPVQEIHTRIAAKIDDLVIGFRADQEYVRRDLIQYCATGQVRTSENSKSFYRADVLRSCQHGPSLACLRERKLENLLGYDMRSRFFPSKRRA